MADWIAQTVAKMYLEPQVEPMFHPDSGYRPGSGGTAMNAVVHCASEEQVCYVRDAIAGCLAHVGLELHPDKTRIVYYKGDDRRSTSNLNTRLIWGRGSR